MTFCFIWFNVSRLFILHTNTQNSLHFKSLFSPLSLLPAYIYLPIYFHAIPCQIHKGQKQCHLPSILRRDLPNSNIVISSNPNLYKLATTKGGLSFILSDNNNYNLDVKVEYCRFVGFVNEMIDYECLEYVFCFKIEEKEKDTFYINFYFIIFLQSFLFFFISHSFNGIIIMDMFVHFIIVVFKEIFITIMLKYVYNIPQNNLT